MSRKVGSEEDAEESPTEYNMAGLFYMLLHRLEFFISDASLNFNTRAMFIGINELYTKVYPYMKVGYRKEIERRIAEISQDLSKKSVNSKAEDDDSGIYHRLHSLRRFIYDKMEERGMIMPKFEIGRDMYDAFLKDLK